MPKGEPQFEEEPVKEIKDAQSFEELYAILDDMKEIRSGQQVYLSDYLKTSIEVLRPKYGPADEIITSPISDPLDRLHGMNTSAALLKITRAEGLRDKVSELLYKEMEVQNEVYQKWNEENRKKSKIKKTKIQKNNSKKPD